MRPLFHAGPVVLYLSLVDIIREVLAFALTYLSRLTTQLASHKLAGEIVHAPSCPRVVTLAIAHDSLEL